METNQLERIAQQVEMLKLAKPITQINGEDFKIVTLRADELIKQLGLENGAMPDEWVKVK